MLTKVIIQLIMETNMSQAINSGVPIMQSNIPPSVLMHTWTFTNPYMTLNWQSYLVEIIIFPLKIDSLSINRSGISALLTLRLSIQFCAIGLISQLKSDLLAISLPSG